MSKQTVFNVQNAPLRYGISLIEASAGTGKTFTLAMLVLRSVVEQNIAIDQLLVVTFTKAATEELKTRIRQRFTEARQYCLDAQLNKDSNLRSWLNSLSIPREQIQLRLDFALQNMDQAGVFTIHGFCQRVLAEHALESGQLFNSELRGDLAQVELQCVDDYWRRQVYPLTAWQASVVCQDCQTPEQLLNSLGSIDATLECFPKPLDGRALLDKMQDLARQASSHIKSILNAIHAVAEDGKFNETYLNNLPQNLDEWTDWLDAKSVLKPELEMLSSVEVMKGLNGNKFRRSKKNPLSSEEQKTNYLQANAIDCQVIDALLSTLHEVKVNFRSAAWAQLHQQIDATLQAMNVLSFDQLITRLAEALQGDKGSLLITALQQRFQVALIDEFQDTDQNQWQIFSSVFDSPQHALYLIGDPKQAIYKFRGADVFTYFAVQQQAQQHYTLGYNWRSHPQLVAAVNRLFARTDPFVFKQLQYIDVTAARKVDEGEIKLKAQPSAPFVIKHMPPNDKSDYWSVRQKETVQQTIMSSICAEIVDLLIQGEIISKQQSRSVCPRDIAILVRGNQEAERYQQALADYNVPSLLNNKASVFKSHEAINLYHVLQAIAQPGQLTTLKQALAINWFALDGQYLYALEQNQHALDGWLARFQQYYECWQQQGLMSMWRQVVETEKLSVKIANLPQAERILTNLQHLLELIQQAVVDEHLSVHKTLAWISHAIQQDERFNGDSVQLRLESDEQAVRIITMHSAKGLEYPVVFCPSLWERKLQLKQQKQRVKCHEQGKLLVDLGSENFEMRKQQALQEELAEELRLCYVALTRAKYRCYLYWADVHTQKEANDSALAYLLDFKGQDFNAQQQALQQLCNEHSEAVCYQLLEIEPNSVRLYQASHEAVDLQCRQRHRNLFSYWQMSSYTGLSALSQQDAPELPEDKADEMEHLSTMHESEPALPKGAHTGNVLHQLLEDIDFDELARGENIASQRKQACRHYGLKIERGGLIDELLQNVVTTPLSFDNGFCLSQLSPAQCLKEMPFYLSQKSMNTREINAILAECPTYQTLDNRQMSGYLTGFIDLICEYQGRYYVMDYKSNALPDYQTKTLVDAMREHNYGLQYWLYTVVLHQYLKQRLPSYDYETHFGGVKYLFMRGMQPQLAGSGVFSDRPALLQIERLSSVFN